MFIGHDDNSDGDDDDDDDNDVDDNDDDADDADDDDNDNDDEDLAEADLVEQRFYKNKKKFKTFTIIQNTLRFTVRFVMKSSSLKLNEDNSICCVYFITTKRFLCTSASFKAFDYH